MSCAQSSLNPWWNIDLYAHIYSFLHKDSHSAFKCTLRRFHIFFTRNYPAVTKIANFIRDNYEIIGGYPSRLDCDRIFHVPGYTLGLGKSDVDPVHSLLSGIIVNLLWDAQYSPALLIEGGPTALESQKMASKALEYVAPQICMQAQTWDVGDSAFKTCKKQNIYTYYLIKHTKRLLTLYSNIDEVSIKACYSCLDETFLTKTLTKVWESISTDCADSCVLKFRTVQDFILSEWKTHADSRPLIRLVLKYWSLFYLKRCQDKPLFARKVEALSVRRNKFMLRIATVTSEAHITGFFLSSLEDAHKLNHYFARRSCSLRSRYLCLVPQQNRTLSQVIVSLVRHIFEQPVSLSLPALTQKAEPEFSTLDHSVQKERLCALDLRQIAGFGKDHLRVWEERALHILDVEIASTREAITRLCTVTVI